MPVPEPVRDNDPSDLRTSSFSPEAAVGETNASKDVSWGLVTSLEELATQLEGGKL